MACSICGEPITEDEAQATFGDCYQCATLEIAAYEEAKED